MAEQGDKILGSEAETKKLIQILWYHISAEEQQRLLSALNDSQRQTIKHCTKDC